MRLSSLGDVILTTPVYRNLKAAFPRARVEVLVKAGYADVFRDNPSVDEVLVFETRGFWGWAGEIRRRRYDVYLDLHDTWRSRLWSWFSGAPTRRRYDKRVWARRWLVWSKRTSPELQKRVVDRYLEVLPALNVPVAFRQPEISAVPVAAEKWNRRLGPGPWIGVAPGAQHATKRWLGGRFAEAADRLATGRLAGGTVLLFGSARDEEAAREVLRHLHGPAVSLVGKTSVGELLSLLGRCSLVLTNDSGVMHAACARRVPTVAVFGSTVESFGFFPEPDCSAVVQVADLPCRPCALHGRARCPLGHFRCMEDVTVEQVLEAAARLLRMEDGG